MRIADVVDGGYYYVRLSETWILVRIVGRVSGESGKRRVERAADGQRVADQECSALRLRPSRLRDDGEGPRSIDPKTLKIISHSPGGKVDRWVVLSSEEVQRNERSRLAAKNAKEIAEIEESLRRFNED